MNYMYIYIYFKTCVLLFSQLRKNLARHVDFRFVPQPTIGSDSSSLDFLHRSWMDDVPVVSDAVHTTA
jgi:hypothetical protein